MGDARFWGGAFVLGLGLFATYKYARVLNSVYPIEQWLFWVLAKLWGWTALFNLACAAFGQLLLVRVLKLKQLPVLESAVFSMAIGTVSFVLAMYVAGAFGWFTTWFAVALPCLWLALGAKHGVRLARDLIAHARTVADAGPLTFLITSAGIVCVGVVYLAAMTPDSLNYDSTWCHLTVAQDYARAGRIVAFPADYTKNVPQFASLIHTWGWLLPGLDAPQRWMLVLHDEFALFVWTLVSVAAGIRRLVRDQTLRASWVAFFLFPIIFVYDNNLGGAADHVCAFFSVPILLATLSVCGSFSPGSAALLAIVSAGAMLTKYQAAYLVGPAGLVVSGVWLLRLFELRGARARGLPPRISARDLLRAPLIVAGLGAVLISPHFIRQAIFHHNPFYPFLQDVLTHSTPTLPGAGFLFSQTITDANWVPRGTLPEKLLHAAKLFLTFSVNPHYTFTHNVPAFGALFTLLLPALFVVRERALLMAAGIASAAVFIWALVYNVDRNLQVFMPVMVCVTGALIVKLWRMSWLARLGLLPLLALQIVWGGDALFYSNHDRIQSSIDLIRSGYENRARARLDGYRSEFLAIGRALPSNARLLLHTQHVSLGIDREVLLDWIGYQSLITYDHVHTPRELYDYYRKLGVTHILYGSGVRPAGTRQEEVVFDTFITRYAKSIGQFGGQRLMALPDKPPPVEPSYRVAVIGLHGYADGVYPIERLNTNEYLSGEFQHYAKPTTPLPAAGDARDALLGDVDALLFGPLGPHNGIKKRFQQVTQFHGQFTLYVANRPNEP